MYALFADSNINVYAGCYAHHQRMLTTSNYGKYN